MGEGVRAAARAGDGATGRRGGGYRASFIVFGVLGAVGIVLQALVGGFDVGLTAFPVNLVIGALVVLAAGGLAVFRDGAAFRLLSGVPFSVTAIGALLVCCLVMGLVPQQDGGGLLDGVVSSWPFVLIYLAMLLSLACVVACSLASFNRRRWGFYLNHIGLWLVLAGAGLGSADRRELTVKIPEGATATHGITAEMMPSGLPFAVRLDDFRMEEYPAVGSARPMPKSFTSEITVTLPGGRTRHAEIGVNHPFRRRSWALYQLGYDRAAGAASSYTVLKAVRDPWLPMVYAGIAMLAVGAFSMFARRKKSEEK